MKEFKKSITLDYDITCIIRWKCPYCGSKKNEHSVGVSPYRILADDAPDVSCTDCGEFVSLNFYKNEEV